MSQSILVSCDGHTFRIGKEKNGYVNVFTNFKPLDFIAFLSALDKLKSVEYLSNIAYYGDNMGGLAIKLNPGKTANDTIEDIVEAFGNQLS